MISKYALILVVLLLASNASQAGGWLKLDVREGVEGTTIGIGGESWFGVARLTTSGFRQLYAGPTIKLGKSATVGAGVGAERTRTESWGLRYAAFAKIRHKPLTLALLYEDGAVTGPFCKAVGTLDLSERFKAGLHYQSNLGLGPRVEFAATKKLSLWGTFLDGKTTYVGLKYSF